MRGNDRGFTLLEVIFTCLLLGILVGLIAGPWNSYRHTRAHREARDEVVAALRNAQIRSVSEGVTYRVDLAPTTAVTYRIPTSGSPVVTRRYTITDRLVRLAGASFEDSAGVVGTRVYFYPRGSASVGSVDVTRSDRSKVYTVSVEGLTARVSFTD
jgi:prepilin-type N-terminal cleavage/methylation domain-containing protein